MDRQYLSIANCQLPEIDEILLEYMMNWFLEQVISKKLPYNNPDEWEEAVPKLSNEMYKLLQRQMDGELYKK